MEEYKLKYLELQENFLQYQTSCQEIEKGLNEEIEKLKIELNEIKNEKNEFLKLNDLKIENQRLNDLNEIFKEEIKNYELELQKNEKNESKMKYLSDSINEILNNIENQYPKRNLELKEYQKFSKIDSLINWIEKKINNDF